MINVNHIDFSYGRRKPLVFSDFSLELPVGKICGLLGKNGTGKSTLLYLMSGLLRVQKGIITFDGQDVTKRLPEVLSDIFIVPEEIELPSLSMEQYVRINAPFYPKFSYEVLDECLKDFELPTHLDLRGLSMGQKKKAFMSFALATGTRLLLMDEPTNGLDIPSKSLFRKVVSRHMSDNQTLVISTHQVRDVDMLLDHVILLEGSHLLLNCSTADICAALRFEERPMGVSTEDALYTQPSIYGNSVIVENHEADNETPINLEMLFNCAEAGKLPKSLTE